MAFHYSPKIVTNGLILYLDAANTKSYISGNTIWNDLTINNYNGTLINNPTFNPNNNGSFTFDGIDDYVTTNYNKPLNDFTICVWFKTIDSTNSQSARLVDKYYIDGFWVGRNPDNSPNSWGGGVLESLPPYGRYLTLTDGQWNFLTSIRSGTTHTLYGNGITNTTSGIVSATTLDTSSFYVARPNHVSNSYYKGNIALVKLYNRALSSSEVLQNYNAIKSRFNL